MRIFSGIQPTGAKHFGNYSGGFRQYAVSQEQGDAFFCIVDLHSITVEYDPADLRERTLDLAATLFATGLDPNRSTVFAQSQVTAHAEAAWLLSAVASYGRLGVSGRIGWLAWLVVHLYYLIGFENRVRVVMRWAWYYVRLDRPVRIILRAGEPRG